MRLVHSKTVFSTLNLVGLLAQLPYSASMVALAAPFLEDHYLGAVASESSICSKTGTRMLKREGNATDAMVAIILCVGTVGMYHSGIGGGGFALVHDKDGSLECVDFRETAPAAA